MRYLLDSSALFAHLFDEPGADDVRELFHNPQAIVELSAVSGLVLFAALNARGAAGQFDNIWAQYRQMLDRIRPVDESVALKAVDLRRAARQRLPNGDALIAATAALANATLVHRDPHLLSIPAELLRQHALPEKSA
ncbi:PIN domain-containing protein [Methylomagnum sp.]